MKPLKFLGIIVGIYLVFVLLFETVYLGYMQPKLERTGIPMLVITTTNEAGASIPRRVARLKTDEGLYVSAHHWTRGWYHDAVANPAVRVEIDGAAADYMAIVVTGDEFRRVAAEFPLPFLVRFLMGFPPKRDLLRLDPVAASTGQ